MVLYVHLQASTRHDAAQVFNVGVSDQQFCESTIGQDAGATMGAHLNPVAAFVDDAATTIIFLIGSKNCRKSQFLKKSFLPFLANELFACIADKSQQLSGQEHYQANVSLTSFEILDEVDQCCGLMLSTDPRFGPLFLDHHGLAAPEHPGLEYIRHCRGGRHSARAVQATHFLR